MARQKRISPRKEPIQQRSIELRNAILQAATYILKKDGPLGFTTNKVADRAGVNIASLYQYYPNKESLLFHLVEMEWAQTMSSIKPILEDESQSHHERLCSFIEAFYKSEHEESNLRQAIDAVGILIEDTQEYKELIKKADEIFLRFLAGAIKWRSKAELKKIADFIHHTITSYSECMPPNEWDDPVADAKIMSKMLCSYFQVNDKRL